MPSFSSTRNGRRSLRSPGLPSPRGRNFGTRNSEMPRLPGGASGVRASTIWTILSVQVVVAIGNKDLLAADPIVLAPALVARRHGAGAQRAEIRAGLRLGQVHRPGPLAGDKFSQIEPLLVLRAMCLQKFDGSEIQQRAQRPAHAGRVPHFHDRRRKRYRQTLAAMIGVALPAPSIRPRHSADRLRGIRAACARRRFRARCRSGRPAGSADQARRRQIARPRRGWHRRHRAPPRPPEERQRVEHETHFFDRCGIGHERSRGASGQLVSRRAGPSPYHLRHFEFNPCRWTPHQARPTFRYAIINLLSE